MDPSFPQHTPHVLVSQIQPARPHPVDRPENKKKSSPRVLNDRNHMYFRERSGCISRKQGPHIFGLIASVASSKITGAREGVGLEATSTNSSTVRVTYFSIRARFILVYLLPLFVIDIHSSIAIRSPKSHRSQRRFQSQAHGVRNKRHRMRCRCSQRCQGVPQRRCSLEQQFVVEV